MSVQAMHAAIQFQHDHIEYAKTWYQQSNYLGFLSVKDEPTLLDIIEQAVKNEINISVFREPDIGNQITAIALAPGPKSKKLCNKIKLALK